MTAPKPSKLDEILIFIDKYTDGEGFLEPKYRKQAKSQILALIEEVIGPNLEETVVSDELVSDGELRYSASVVDITNKCKAIQRLRKDAL